MAFFRVSNGGTDIVPLRIEGQNIYVANNNTDYTLSSGGDSAHFITNGIVGTVVLSFVYGDRVTVKQYKKDGTSTNVSTGNIVVDDTVLGFSFYDAVNHIAQYKFNFSY